MLTYFPSSDFDRRVRVLQQLSYLNEDSSVQLKGRVACEINSTEGLIVAELLFDNGFTDLMPGMFIFISFGHHFFEGAV